MKLPLGIVLVLSLCLYSSQAVSGDDRDKVRVCVIGAGAAGLSTARYLTQDDDEDRFEVTVYEKSPEIGGTWVYTDEVGHDKHGYPIHSSMYKNLRTNLAKEFMNFPDYPEIQGQNRSCVPHAVILEYLNNYTDHFNLRPLIKFNSPVESVKLDESAGPKDQWIVRVKNLETGEPEEETFDAVIICNGHYSDPYYPKIPGMENFEGVIMHSHSYRVPEVFKGKKVVLLGAASSGLDIALEVVKYADQTYLSHNNPDKVTKRKPLGFTEVKGIARFEDGKFVLRDNRTLVADAIIFCTGYNFKYPFLDANTGIVVDDNYIKPLYRHMFNVDHPSMSFVGVPTGVVPFSMLHVQSQYIASVLKGKAHLPSKEVMEQDAKLKAAKKRHAHKISNQWAFSDELAREGGFAPLPRYYRVASEAWNILKREYPGDFKNFNLVIGADKVSVKIIRLPYRKV